MSQLLQYNYAILGENNICVACRTCSYEVPLDYYILIPTYVDDYVGYYYSYETDLWYVDNLYTVEATEINEMYHG